MKCPECKKEIEPEPTPKKYHMCSNCGCEWEQSGRIIKHGRDYFWD